MKTSESKYSNCLYFTSNSLARKIEKLALESWKKVDLSPSHAYLLMMVIENPGVQPGYISDHLQLTPSTVTRLIEKLESKKLVVRTTEGKISNVYATPKGKEMLPKLRECSIEFQSNCSNVFGKEETTKLVQTINKNADKINL